MVKLLAPLALGSVLLLFAYSVYAALVDVNVTRSLPEYSRYLQSSGVTLPIRVSVVRTYNEKQGLAMSDDVIYRVQVDATLPSSKTVTYREIAAVWNQNHRIQEITPHMPRDAQAAAYQRARDIGEFLGNNTGISVELTFDPQNHPAGEL